MALFEWFLKMKITLNEIADIKSGFTFRTSIEDQVEGNVRILQIKDMRGHTLIQSDVLKLPKTVWEGRGEPPILQRGDVLLTARGEKKSRSRGGLAQDAARSLEHSGDAPGGQSGRHHPRDLQTEIDGS